MRAQLCQFITLKAPLISNQQRQAAILGQFNINSFPSQVQTAHLGLKVQISDFRQPPENVVHPQQLPVLRSAEHQGPRAHQPKVVTV